MQVLCFCVFNRIGPTNVAKRTFRHEPFSLRESHFADALMSREILQVRTAQVNPGKKKRKKQTKTESRDKHWLPKVKTCVGTSKKKKICVCIFFLHCWHLPIVMHRLNKLKLASVQHSTQKYSVMMSSHLEKAGDIFPRPSILFSFFDFIQCLNHNAILWFSSFRGFNHTPRCSVHAPHLLCFSQTDAMVLLSFHTRSLTQANSRPLGKFKTGQGTMNHASQRKKNLGWPS